MRLILLLTLLFSSLSVMAETCPLGPKEDHLILARVMRNFGKAVRDSDYLAVKAKQWPDDITTEEILAAAKPIVMGIACADEAIDHPEGDLLPRKIEELEGEMKEIYLQHYLDGMKKFRQGLLDYKKILDDLAALPQKERKFEALYIHYKLLDDMVNEAHNHLGGG